MTLASWNDGAARTAILEFVERVTEEGGADYVPPAERIAVLDNDGTLWCEKPTYVQALFVLARLRRGGRGATPSSASSRWSRRCWPATSPARSSTASRRSPACCSQLDAGRTTEEFTRDAAAWFAAAQASALRRAVPRS